MKKFVATKNDEGRTIYKFVLKVLKDVSISKIEKLFRKKQIRLNDQKTFTKKTIIKENDTIVIYQVFSEHLQKSCIPKTRERNFKIIFEDKNILIIDKEPNISMHGYVDALDNQVLSYLKWKQTDSFTPSHIGRLDRVTSGIVVYAKNYSTLRELKTNWNKTVKVYRFESELARDVSIKLKLIVSKKLQKTIPSSKGKDTKTTFFIKNQKKYARIHTGFKHQIRATLAFLKCPIYGDTKYGGKKAKRVFLHSWSLQFKSLGSSLNYLNNKRFTSSPRWEKENN